MAPYGGLYISHIRSEADHFLEALDEAIEIGRSGGVPVEIYHLKAAGRRNWPKAEAAIARIAAARARGLDVGADMYPYVAGSTGPDRDLAALGLGRREAVRSARRSRRAGQDPGRSPRPEDRMGEHGPCSPPRRPSSSSASRSPQNRKHMRQAALRDRARRGQALARRRDGPDPLRAPEHRHGLFPDERGEPQAPVASALDQVRHRCRGAGPRASRSP